MLIPWISSSPLESKLCPPLSRPTHIVFSSLSPLYAEMSLRRSSCVRVNYGLISGDLYRLKVTMHVHLITCLSWKTKEGMSRGTAIHVHFSMFTHQRLEVSISAALSRKRHWLRSVDCVTLSLGAKHFISPTVTWRVYFDSFVYITFSFALNRTSVTFADVWSYIFMCATHTTHRLDHQLHACPVSLLYHVILVDITN